MARRNPVKPTKDKVALSLSHMLFDMSQDIRFGNQGEFLMGAYVEDQNYDVAGYFKTELTLLIVKFNQLRGNDNET